MKLLYFDSIMPTTNNGGYIGMERNLAMVEYVFGKENIYVCRLNNPTKTQGLKNFMLNRSFYHSKINNKIIEQAKTHGPYDLIFLNGPLVYKYLEEFITTTKKIYLYCHNVDYEYYRNKYRISRKLPDYIMSVYIKRMEKFAVNKSTLISTLNQRDSDGLLKLYGRKADFILPIAMDGIDENALNQPDETETYGLFVGSDIGPNIEGLKWFFENVAPYTPTVRYFIVGSCCNILKNDHLPKNVILKGFVEDLDKIYNDASFVICPIFSGSGMKTKTIEALRYGKTIIGTNEAFEGINVNYELVGVNSNFAKDHIKTINSLNLAKKFNPISYQEFDDKFTYKVVFKKFEEAIGNLFL